jgi:hypothetical protein
VRSGDALYPYSPVFLATLPRTALALPREPVALARILARAPATHRTLVAIPNGRAWSILVVPGPFANVPAALSREARNTHGIARAAALQLYLAATRSFERRLTEKSG